MRAHEHEVLRDLKTFIELESPTTDKAAVDRAGRFLAEKFEAYAGARITWHRQSDYGDHFEARVGDGPRPVLVVGHFDTVWPMGTLEQMPCVIDEDRVTGPGSYDMKYGDIQALWALRALKEAGRTGDKTFVFLANADEEVGSPSSRSLIEKLARESEIAFVLEASVGPEGRVKLWRKGVGLYRIEVEGRASHAGGAPEQGRSAVLEMARQIADLYELNHPETGTTLNVGTVSGGTRTNVVAAHAHANIDLRVRTTEEAERAHQRIMDRPTFVEGTRLTVTGGLNRPPMEETKESRRLYELARTIAAEEGFDLPWGGTGGGSDGNFIAAAGTPTLDGLGAVGDGAHANHEHVTRVTIVPRLAWFARLLARC